MLDYLREAAWSEVVMFDFLGEAARRREVVTLDYLREAAWSEVVMFDLLGEAARREEMVVDSPLESRELTYAHV